MRCRARVRALFQSSHMPGGHARMPTCAHTRAFMHSREYLLPQSLKRHVRMYACKVRSWRSKSRLSYDGSFTLLQKRVFRTAVPTRVVPSMIASNSPNSSALYQRRSARKKVGFCRFYPVVFFANLFGRKIKRICGRANFISDSLHS